MALREAQAAALQGIAPRTLAPLASREPETPPVRAIGLAPLAGLRIALAGCMLGADAPRIQRGLTAARSILQAIAWHLVNARQLVDVKP